MHSKLAAGSKGFRLMIDKEALVAVHVELTPSRRLSPGTGVTSYDRPLGLLQSL